MLTSENYLRKFVDKICNVQVHKLFDPLFRNEVQVHFKVAANRYFFCKTIFGSFELLDMICHNLFYINDVMLINIPLISTG